MLQASQFGKYTLLDRISVGGMAEVFCAKQCGLHGFEKVIALKRILPQMSGDAEFIKMFVDEAKIAGQLSHSNICQIFELGEVEGTHFIAMEHIWGKDLLQLGNRMKRKNGTVPTDAAAYIVSKICEGLDYAHRKRDALGVPLEIIHRDCSPQNVLVSFEGEVKVIDFGIAKAAGRLSRTNVGVLKGKFGYMSPEQVRGLPIDRRSDIFSVGTLFYELLTGERLFAGASEFSTLEKVRKVEIDPPKHLNPAVPDRVNDIVLKALARNPDERYQWCSEMRVDLQEFLTTGERPYTAKCLATLMTEAFGREKVKEKRRMEELRRLDAPNDEPGAALAGAGAVVEREVDDIEGFSTEFDPVLPFAPGEIAEMRQDSMIGEPATGAGPEPGIGTRKTVAIGAEFDEVAAALDSSGAARATPAPVVAPVVGATASPQQATLLAPEGLRSFVPSGAAASMPAGLGTGAVGGAVQSMPRESTAVVTAGSTAGAPIAVSPSIKNQVSLRPLPAARRQTFARDIIIGVAIAVSVLGAFAAVKLFIMTEEPPATGTLAIVAVSADGKPGQALLDGTVIGNVSSDPLLLKNVPLGKHVVVVRRQGGADCLREVEVVPGDMVVARCESIAPKAELGYLVLQGVQAKHRIFLGDKELSLEAAREEIKLVPNSAYRVYVRIGDALVQEFRVRVKAGERARRIVTHR